MKIKCRQVRDYEALPSMLKLFKNTFKPRSVHISIDIMLSNNFLQVWPAF